MEQGAVATGYITPPNPLIHPFAYLDAKRVRTFQERSKSQEAFFSDLIGLIDGSSLYPILLSPILFKGYDSEFMDRAETQKAIETFLKRKTTFPPLIGAVFSANDKISPGIDQLVKDYSGGIKIKIVNERFTDGFIIYGLHIVSTWDSKRKTYYPPESETVIFRELINNRDAADNKKEEFMNLWHRQ